MLWINHGIKITQISVKTEHRLVIVTGFVIVFSDLHIKINPSCEKKII